MPRPPILPVIDWEKVFNSGKTFEDWLADAEDAERRGKMAKAHLQLVLDPQQHGFLKAVPKKVRVIAIAEDWCGDVVRHVPALQKVADASPNVEARYIQREQWPDVFVRFLTNGGEAIPKFVFLSQDWVECGSWGPMPAACRELIARGKGCGDVGAAREKVSALYAADPDLRIVAGELIHLVDTAASLAP